MNKEDLSVKFRQTFFKVYNLEYAAARSLIPSILKIYYIAKKKYQELRKIFTGIIAEFNPLHKGHEKLLHFVQSEGVIVILSGNFTQRGSPAVLDKFLRAELALKAGADLVLELPFLYACSAGQDFARGAVEILGRLGFVSSLTFGMEDTDFNVMTLVDAMLNENDVYKNFLHEELKKGASFTKANSIALEKVLPGSYEFLSKPNNLLAVSYILQVKKNNFNIEIFKMKRKGNFQSKVIRETLQNNSELLKNFLTSSEKPRGVRNVSSLHEIFDMMPSYSQDLILDANLQGRFCYEKKLWTLLQNIFIRSRPEDLRKIYGIDEGIEGLFLKNWRSSKGLDDFIGRCVCARYTRAHIRRRLIYIMLGLERWEIWGALRQKIPYVRVLGFNGKGREILRRYGKNSGIKIITRLSEVKSKHEKFFADIEFKASQLHELLMDKPDMQRETYRVLQFT